NQERGARWSQFPLRTLKRVSIRLNHSLRRVMRGLDPRIHLLRKKSFEAGWIAGSKPGNDASLWFDMNASRFSDAGLSELQLGRADLPCIPFDRFAPSAVPAAQV